MKDQNLRLYRLLSLLVELIFGLLLVLNGVMLITNYFGLALFEEKPSNFLSIDSFFRKTVYEWRSLVEFLHAMIATHLSVFVMVCLGLAVLSAAIHNKRSP